VIGRDDFVPCGKDRILAAQWDRRCGCLCAGTQGIAHVAGHSLAQRDTFTLRPLARYGKYIIVQG
jgi:hypothetical protein